MPSTPDFVDQDTESRQPMLPCVESPPSTPSKSASRIRCPYVSPQQRRTVFLTLWVLAALTGLVFLLSRLIGGPKHSFRPGPVRKGHNQLSAQTVMNSAYSPWVKGPPTQKFRDNLRDDHQYITSWLSAGWNNDVMTYMNLIYLAMITDRVPIVAMFVPLHIGSDADVIRFGDIFDVPRFIEDAGFPLLEWYQVKDAKSNIWDDLGCWNVWEAVQYSEHHPRHSVVPEHLRLDVSYTKAPEWVKIIPGYEHDLGSSFWSLARLTFPEDRTENLGSILPSPLRQTRLDPDEHLMCYDYVFFVGVAQTHEFDFNYSPAWRYVGKHLHFTKEVQDLVRESVNTILGLPQSQHLPAYITVHVRHGDFKDWCVDAEHLENCFAPLHVIARRVKEVQDELWERNAIHVPTSRVIITSDERDPLWWADVEALGWVKMDHEKLGTVERFGKWYPLILDSAIQASGIGFVGTDRSTFSVLSRRRVLDWNKGVARIFKWGWKGADDH